MSRKNRSPEEKARRAKIRELLQMANIDSMDDIQDLFKGTIAEFMENGLEAELDEDLGYSKYDYKNKATDNSRNGHSSKNLRTSFGDVEVSVPRDRKGEFEPQLLKKNQTSISRDTVSRSPACGERMAAAASGIDLCRGFSGCDPLPCPQRRADRKESSVHCHRP